MKCSVRNISLPEQVPVSVTACHRQCSVNNKSPLNKEKSPFIWSPVLYSSSEVAGSWWSWLFLCAAGLQEEDDDPNRATGLHCFLGSGLWCGRGTWQDEFHVGCCPQCPLLCSQALLNLARYPKSVGRYSEQETRQSRSTLLSNKGNAKRKSTFSLGSDYKSTWKCRVSY